MDVDIIAWIAFNSFVLAMLGIDLYIFHRDSHVVRYKEALVWSVVWICLALLFCMGIYWTHGSEPSLNFLAGYLIEKALSVDNLFIFLVIFSYFAVPERYLHKVLFWGVLGALVMRALFIFAGVVLIQQFHWIIYIFGALLIITGIKLAFQEEHEVHPEKNFILRIFRKFVPITPTYEDGHFFVKKEGRYFATPLFVVLIVIETTDIMFAIDSVPAILAITTDPFIVYTSNVFAILGLRSLYFALAHLMGMFHYLNYGLAVLLVFIGAKMLLSDIIHIPITVALAVIVLVLGSAIVASLFTTKPTKKKRKSG